MYLWREHTEGCHLAYVLFITKILLLVINKGLLDGLTRHAYFGVSNTQKRLFPGIFLLLRLLSSTFSPLLLCILIYIYI